MKKKILTRRPIVLWSCAALAAGMLSMVPSTSATSVTLNFSVPGASGNVVDANGIATPFTTYLPGTDPLSTAPATPNPDLLLSGGAFTLTTAGANTDFAGANDITAVNTPGIDLGSIGFTGANDIEINAVFAPIVCEFIDQVCVYVGFDSSDVTFAGEIAYWGGAPDLFSCDNVGTVNTDGNIGNGLFLNTGDNGWINNILPLNTSIPMSVTIIRYQGNWVYFVDGVMINPLRAGSLPSLPAVPVYYNTPAPIPNPDLDAASDLFAGIFFTTPLDNAVEPTTLKSFQAQVDNITLPAPVISSQPVSQVVQEGNAAETMSVTATYAVSYQWYQNNVALAGETNSVLIISDTEPANAGVYQCAVIGVGGALNTVMSGSATLGVLIPLPGASQVVNFATASGGTVQDENGNGIGLSAYFPGTGGGTTGEPNPNMDLAGGVLTLDNNSADWNGANTSLLTAPALDLATIGFTGSQDFNATVHFGAITDWAWDDQAGLMIGDNINGLTRAGYVGNWWFTPSTTAFSGYDTVAAGNADEYVNDGPAIDMSENLIVTVGRKAGTWYWTINGESDILTSPWYGGVQPTGLNNTPNLNATTDMWAGFYVDSPQGTSVGVPYTVESFAARVFAPPQILASKNGSTLNLSWNVVGLGLVSSTDLVTWTPVPGTAGVSSLAVTIPATGNRYYGIAPLP